MAHKEYYIESYLISAITFYNFLSKCKKKILCQQEETVYAEKSILIAPNNHCLLFFKDILC